MLPAAQNCCQGQVEALQVMNDLVPAFLKHQVGMIPQHICDEKVSYHILLHFLMSTLC